MAARLAFSAAIHTEPDILLIDEVLAVGDSRFRSKCYRRLDELMKKDLTLVMVSHNPEAILATCKKALYLSGGRVASLGEALAVVKSYESEDLSGSSGSRRIPAPSVESQRPELNTDVTIRSLFFRDPNGQLISSPRSGRSLSLCMAVESRRESPNMVARISISRLGIPGEVLFLSNLCSKEKLHIMPGANEIDISFPFLGLMPDNYVLRAAIIEGGLYELDTVSNFSFKVSPSPEQTNLKRSTYYQPTLWTVTNTRQLHEVTEALP